MYALITYHIDNSLQSLGKEYREFFFTLILYEFVRRIISIDRYYCDAILSSHLLMLPS